MFISDAIQVEAELKMHCAGPLVLGVKSPNLNATIDH